MAFSEAFKATKGPFKKSTNIYQSARKSQIPKILQEFSQKYLSNLVENGKKSGLKRFWGALKRLARLVLQCSHIEEDRAQAAFKCVARKINA